jgi:hypothetical protein
VGAAAAALLQMLLLLLVWTPSRHKPRSQNTCHKLTSMHLPHRFSTTHNFEKPNDKRALDLMDECAKVSLTYCPCLYDTPGPHSTASDPVCSILHAWSEQVLQPLSAVRKLVAAGLHLLTANNMHGLSRCCSSSWLLPCNVTSMHPRKHSASCLSPACHCSS